MLETVGVEPPDEEAYRALLSAPGCDVRDLAEQLGRDERDLADTVGRLEKLGLLTTTSDDPVRLLRPVPMSRSMRWSPYDGLSSTGFARRLE